MEGKERLARIRALLDRLKGEEKPLAEAYLTAYDEMTSADRAPDVGKARNAAAETFLTEYGRSRVPDYMPNDRTAAAAVGAAAKNLARVRELFARNAGNPDGDSRRDDGRVWLEAADLAYRGAEEAEVFGSVLIGKGILREKKRLILRKFTAADLPEPLRPVYDETSGLLHCRGLRAFLAFCGESVVVAFSGTVLDTRMIEADLTQAFAYSWVYLWAAGLIAALAKQYAASPFVLCGHSLGGGLAQFSLAANRTENAAMEAFCYNAAGLNYVAYESLKRMGGLERARTHVWHYVVEGEPVSAFFGQIGKITSYPAPRGFNLYQRHRLAAVRMSMDDAVY